MGWLAREIMEPTRNLPRAPISGTVCVNPLRRAQCAVCLGDADLRDSGVLPIVQKRALALGSHASYLVAALIAVAALSSAGDGDGRALNLLSDGSIPFALIGPALARDRPWPSSYKRLWASVLVEVFGVFERVVLYVGFAITIFSPLRGWSC